MLFDDALAICSSASVFWALLKYPFGILVAEV